MLHGMSMSHIPSVAHPRYADGKQIINEETEWVRLWVIAGTNRIYFHFDFEH